MNINVEGKGMKDMRGKSIVFRPLLFAKFYEPQFYWWTLKLGAHSAAMVPGDFSGHLPMLASIWHGSPELRRYKTKGEVKKGG
jgi:hypothetical protein